MINEKRLKWGQCGYGGGQWSTYLGSGALIGAILVLIGQESVNDGIVREL